MPIWIAIVATISIFANKNIRVTPPYSKKLDIAIFAGNYKNEDKTNRYKILKNIDYYIKNGFKNNTQLIILPESAVSVELNDIKGYLKQKFKPLKKENKELFFGGYYNTKNYKLYNAVIKATTLKPLYAKNHLIPFGEYIPKPFEYLDSIIPRFRMNNIARGNNKYIFKYQDISFLSTVCYELLFELEWQKDIKNADVILNISDIGWFKNSWATPYMLRVAQIRAAEFAKPVIYSVNMGKSAYILPNGKISKITTNNKDVVFATIKIFNKESIYAKYGLSVVWLLVALWIIAVMLIKKI